jgi:hypothetical protein
MHGNRIEVSVGACVIVEPRRGCSIVLRVAGVYYMWALAEGPSE